MLSINGSDTDFPFPHYVTQLANKITKSAMLPQRQIKENHSRVTEGRYNIYSNLSQIFAFINESKALISTPKKEKVHMGKIYLEC